MGFESHIFWVHLECSLIALLRTFAETGRPSSRQQHGVDGGHCLLVVIGRHALTDVRKQGTWSPKTVTLTDSTLYKNDLSMRESSFGMKYLPLIYDLK
jgi:hypothetical protein